MIMTRKRRTLLRALFLILLTVLLRCAPDAPYKFANSPLPEQLNDGWEIATPGEVGIDQAALNKVYSDFVSENMYYNAVSLLIIKNGKLVFETYCRDISDRDRYAHIQSATKSITSLAFGKALSEGYIDSLDQRLYSIIPDKFPADASKQTITLRHLLTMTSGIEFDNDDFSVELYVDRPLDPIAYILKKPLYAEPGTRFYYRDCDPHLISYVIQRVTGVSEEQWVKSRIFEPLGITEYYWDKDHTGVTMGAHGLFLRPRDLAKIGQLVLDHGRWQSAQVIDSAWVAEATQFQTSTDWRTEPHVYDYGFYWWIVPRRQAFTASGHGGNFVFILPQKGMIIVMTSLPDVDNEVVGTKLDDFETLISPLLEN